ncbi:hypothetical protein F0562_029472 [Nyssa sinensis]|uniref:Uncharacterized protein n=1 Tax=Nyssa sinensis TaxID=561372 RepID=A0A5J5B385_9ASTE|nr:hypothetical protein F0562_029472 [Nyssa sinensis]
MGETIANGVPLEAVDQTVLRFLAKEDLRFGDVVVLEKRWRWGRHLTVCRVLYAIEVVDGGAIGVGWIGLKVEQWSFGLDGD